MSKTHQLGKTWDIGSHTFSIKWVLFFPLNSHPVVYFIIWEMHEFSHQFSIVWENTGKPNEWKKPEKLVPRKILQNPLYVEDLINWYSHLSHSMGAFFPLDSHPMVYIIICETHCFLHQFPIAWKNAANWEILGN